MVLTAKGGRRPVKPPPSSAHPNGLNRHQRQRSAHRLLHSWPSPLPWLLFFILLLSDKVPWPWAAAIFADYATVPKGTNPTLYDAQDFVVQLDEQTFNDTVFCSFAAAGGGGGLAADANANGSAAAAAAAFPVVAADEVMMRAAAERCTSLVVEFYSDWCGHCRAYAQVYKALAKDLLGWSPVLKLAAINCADPINLMVCRASGITHYPFIKYFPRNSTGLDAAASGQLLRSYQSLAQMRDQFTRAILAEYEENRYADWPDFDWLGEVETYSQLWEGVPAHLHTMAVIFEPNTESLVGAQLLLDLSTYADRLVARRCANAALAQALQIHDLPSFAVFRRGERSPLFIAELRRLLLNEFEQFMHNETSVAMASPAARLLTFARRRAIGGHSSGGGQQQQKQEHFCDANPEICRRAYFVSEQDILKAARIALFNDIHLGGPRIGGRNLSALYNFVDALYLPFRSLHSLPEGLSPSGEAEHDGGGGGGHIRTQFLNASSRARVVFSHLREFIDSNGGPDAGGASISVDAWRAEFLRAELDQGRPFPTVEGWEHCKGSSPVLRGFTCGLWMLFHALTVNAYRNGQKDERFHPIALLHAIRDWVAAFFACEHCRVHFHRMTTKVARIESQVRRKEDVFLYLWRAHNLVNGRLRGRETEDPHFPKYQFPPRFLCPDCRTAAGRGEVNGTEEAFEEAKVKPFLLAFYSDVRPIGGAATNDGELALRRADEEQAADEEEKVPEEEEEADGKRRARRSRSSRAQQQFEQQM